MQRPTLLTGVVMALLLSLLAGPSLVLWQLLVGGILASKAALSMLTYTYICYLLIQSDRRSGRVTLALLAFTVLLASLMLGLQFTPMLLLCVALIWGIRSLAYSRSLISAVLQGGVCLLGCGAALTVYRHSGGLALAIWSFFLLQAVFVYVPARLTRQPALDTHEEERGSTDGFVRAYHAAEQALSLMESNTAR